MRSPQDGASIVVMVGKDLERLSVACDGAPSRFADELPETRDGHDPQLAVREVLDDDGGANGVAELLQFAGERDDVAVADATDLHDLHGPKLSDPYIPVYPEQIVV